MERLCLLHVGREAAVIVQPIGSVANRARTHLKQPALNFERPRWDTLTRLEINVHIGTVHSGLPRLARNGMTEE